MATNRSLSTNGFGIDTDSSIGNYIENDTIYFNIRAGSGGDGSDATQDGSGGSGAQGRTADGHLTIDGKNVNKIGVQSGNAGNDAVAQTSGASGGTSESIDGSDGQDGEGTDSGGGGGGGGASDFYINDQVRIRVGGGGGGGGGGKAGGTFSTEQNGGDGGSGGGPGGDGGSGGTAGGDGENGGLPNVDTYNGGVSSYDAGYNSGDGSATASWTELAPPDYVPSIDNAPSSVVSGDDLVVDYSVTNNGEASESYTVELLVAGSVVDSANNTSTGSLSYTTSASDEGTGVDVDVRVTHDAGSDTASTTVDILTPATFTVTIQSINTTVDQTEDVIIDYQVENTGDVDGTQDIRLLRNGTQIQSETGVTLTPSETFLDSFTYTPQFEDIESSPDLTVETDDDSVSNTITVNATLTVSGQVTLSGSGVQGATVRGIRTDADEYLTTETTDSSGNYSVSPVPAEDVQFIVEYEDGGQLYRAYSQPSIGSGLSGVAYTVPDRNNVDFALETHTAPATDSVDLSFQGISRETATAEEMTIEAVTDSGTATPGVESNSEDSTVSVSLENTTSTPSTTPNSQDVDVAVTTDTTTAGSSTNPTTSDMPVEAETDSTTINSSTTTTGEDTEVETTIDSTALESSATSTSQDLPIEVGTSNHSGTTGSTATSQDVSVEVKIDDGTAYLDRWSIATPESTEIAPGTNESEQSTFDDLTLTFVVDRSTRNELRRLADNAGDLEIDDLAGGRFRATDMVGGDNTFVLSPPIDRKDVAYNGEVLVDDYSERRIGNTGETFRVSVTFVKRRTRSESGGYPTETVQGDEWLFEFADGTIAKQRGIDAESIEEDVSGTSQLRLSLALTYPETRIIREVTNRLAGDGIEEVSTSDGPDGYTDNTGRNTVDITAPSGGEEILPSGQYVVVDWSIEWTGRLYQVDLELGT